ncbi:hypothetical protein AYL99_03586 [Fonsecaea erecta]|uniref:Uncharacterized protein n=1 Tax=Fonsecaea erecta TaxID=1367422 RepID=A0A178ZQB4_9EURO|nr:hypothetical protein AYL99_03586 [Fonsecaea erecta]OAP61383.1 hypothetical protein AYL99_03586 [Fonsecaea erecta]
MHDKAFINIEEEELELDQRQLDLDRKRLQLRLQRAMLNKLVEAAPEHDQAQLKEESVQDITEIEPVKACNKQLSSPGRDEAGGPSTTDDHGVTQEVSLPQYLILEAASRSSREHHGGGTASHDRVTTSGSPPDMTHPSALLTKASRLLIYSPGSQTTSSKPPLNDWRQDDGLGHLPTSSPHKRARSPGSESVLEKTSTPGVKRVEKSTSNKEVQSQRNTKSSKVQGLPARHISAILRKYGERLVQRHMLSFRKHERREADQVINAGSMIIDGLLEKKFNSLDELHDEYDRQIRLCCTRRLQESLTNELEKFRRAGPVWWRQCMNTRTQQKRLADLATVFKHVVEGIFD